MKGEGKAAHFLRRAAADARFADIGLYAANGAYYLFLSLGPLTALLLALLPYTPLTEQQLLDGVLAYAPAATGLLVSAIVRDVYAASPAALSMSLGVELWSGARFLACVVRGIGAIGDGGRRGYLRTRLAGAALTAALALFILGNLMLLLFGRRLESAFPALGQLMRLRALVFLAGLTGLNLLLYRCASGAGGLRRRAVGAAFAAVMWLAFSRLYSWALERFGVFGVYGSIAGVAVSLYWMYGSLYILFLGAWLGTLWAEEG